MSSIKATSTNITESNQAAVRRYTPQQEAAIKHRGSSLLVSSAAGSGKTMVLVERLLSYIDEGHNIDEFLVITYTRAAAQELRERIYERLHQRLSETPGDMHIRRQLMLCRGAFIDTIHTVCSAILRENAHLVSLPPDFRVAENNECNIMQSGVINDVFNRTYEDVEGCFGFRELLNLTVEGRDDTNLVNMITDLYQVLRSIPDYKAWINNECSKLQNPGNTGSSNQVGSILLQSCKKRVEHCLDILGSIRKEMNLYSDFNDKYGDSINESIYHTKQLLQAIDSGWDAAILKRDIPFSKPKPISGYDDLKAKRTWCKDELQKISSILVRSSSDHIADLSRSVPAVTALFHLILEFDKSYTDEKRKRGLVDFSDLEHLTLNLLIDMPSQRKTVLAASLSQRFREILIDEYQDVNRVQEMLFGLLSTDGNNIFMVGDVKQSIYRFRLADPSIFLDKYRQFSDYPAGTNTVEITGKAKPVKINLSMNFRSQPHIPDVINHIFRNIMSTEIGEMEYGDDEALVAGRVSNNKCGSTGNADTASSNKGIHGIQGLLSGTPAMEIDLISFKAATGIDEDNPKLIQVEAEHIAGRIKSLIDSGLMIEDKDGSARSLRYSDIAILLRSHKNKLWRFTKALSDLGIPTDISATEDYFGTPETKIILSLLTVIDNPISDIPLAAVLSGPIYNFTSDELAHIRAAGRDMTFYEALTLSSEPITESSDLATKCKHFLDELNELRELAYDLPADRFIWNVYNRTGLLKHVSSMVNGRKRKDNLLKLVDYAHDFVQYGYKGLYSFLTYLNLLQSRDEDIPDISDGGQGSISDNNAVRIMSIHKSKGLEFPVVILADTSKKHNLLDLNKLFLFHKDSGIGVTMTDREKRIRYPSLTRIEIADKLKNELFSEELRVLYVALTRAREKIIVTGAYSDALKKYNEIKYLADRDNKYTPFTLLSFSSFIEWILAGTMGLKENICINQINYSAGSENAALAEKTAAVGTPATDIPADYPPHKSFDFKYPYESSVNLPSKLTVTELKSFSGNTVNDTSADTAQWVGDEGTTDTAGKHYSRKPRFLAAVSGLTAAERGTLVHDILRYIDLKMCSSDSDMRKDLQRLAESGFISEPDIALLSQSDIRMIVNLFKSETGKRMSSATKLVREFKFSLLTPAKIYYPDSGDDEILVQGIIDCYFEEDNELVIIDFKTDNVTSANIDKLTELYTPQLMGYSDALHRITGMKIRERIIYFLKTGDALSV